MQEYNETGLKSFKTPRTREGKQAGKGGQPAEKQKWKEGGGRCKWRGRLCETERHTEREREEREEREGWRFGGELRTTYSSQPTQAGEQTQNRDGWRQNTAESGRVRRGEEGGGGGPHVRTVSVLHEETKGG